MKHFSFILIIPLMMIFTRCTQQKTTDKGDTTFNLENLDTIAAPGTDFYQYATGGWQKNNPIPADKSRFGSFDKLADDNQKQIQQLIEDLGKEKNVTGSNAQKVGDLYNIAMDSTKLNTEGADPIKPFLAEIAAAKDKKDIITLMAKISKYASNPFFGFYVGPDDKNSSMNIAQLFQGGIELGDRDYYLAQDEHSKTLREGYIKLMETQFENAGYTEDNAKKAAITIMRIETELARSHVTKEIRRIPERNYHKLLLNDLNNKVAKFDWKFYFDQMGAGKTDSLNVAQIEPIKKAIELIYSEPIENLKDYLSWKIINSASNYLSDNFVNAYFEFYDKLMGGSKQIRPRWKRSVNAVNAALGEAVGQLYVKKYFPPEAKERMLNLVHNLMKSLGKRIDSLMWMSDTTKAKAHEKLTAITIKIGYPDKWKDYSTLEIKNDSYWANMMRAADYEYHDMIKDLGKPVDKTKWLMTPQTVNAYYNPSSNEIVFPAGILQPPFFYKNGDDAINYGAIGVVIGHEMTHGFDDQGRKYNKEGNLADWWTAGDAVRFEKRTKVLEDHFNNIVVLDTVHANGVFTLGENIADQGGLQISYQAFQQTEEAKANKKIDGFTPAQRFFLSYANVWAGNIRNEEILRRTKLDPHSLGKWRVNGALPQIDGWYDAFNIKPADPLYIPKEKRVSIW